MSPLLLPLHMHNAHWCQREPHGAWEPLEHMYHLGNNKDKGTPFYLNSAKRACVDPSLSRWSQLRRNNHLPGVEWLPPFQGELFIWKRWSSSQDGFRFPKSLLLGDMIRKCHQSFRGLIKSTKLLYTGGEKRRVKRRKKREEKKSLLIWGKRDISFWKLFNSFRLLVLHSEWRFHSKSVYSKLSSLLE